MKRGSVLDLFSTSVEELVRNVLLKINFASGDYEMAVFKILKAARNAHSMLITLYYGRADFGISKGLFSRMLCDKALDGRPRKLADIQGLPPPKIMTNTSKPRQKFQKFYMDK